MGFGLQRPLQVGEGLLGRTRHHRSQREDLLVVRIALEHLPVERPGVVHALLDRRVPRSDEPCLAPGRTAGDLDRGGGDRPQLAGRRSLARSRGGEREVGERELRVERDRLAIGLLGAVQVLLLQ